jgi:hypothetical protein
MTLFPRQQRFAFTQWIGQLLALGIACSGAGCATTKPPDNRSKEQIREEIRLQNEEELRFRAALELKARTALAKKSAATINIDWNSDQSSKYAESYELELLKSAKADLSAAGVEGLLSKTEKQDLEIKVKVSIRPLSGEYFDSELGGRKGTGKIFYTGASILGSVSLVFSDPNDETKYSVTLMFGAEVPVAYKTARTEKQPLVDYGVKDADEKTMADPKNAPYHYAIAKARVYESVRYLISVWRETYLRSAEAGNVDNLRKAMLVLLGDQDFALRTMFSREAATPPQSISK